MTAIGTFFTTTMGMLKDLDILKNWFRPEMKNEEILLCCRELSAQIGQVTVQIRNLDKLIKLESTELQFADVVQRIQLGMEMCLRIENEIGQAEMDNQGRLKELCANQNVTLALDALLDGMTGKVLDNLYERTQGDRHKIIALTNRLEQMVCGGMIVLVTFETLMRGVEGSKDMTTRYGSRLKEVSAKVQSVIDWCVKHFEGNMLSDLNDTLDKGGSNEVRVIELSEDMRVKYDWLENFTLVYNDLQGFDQHCFSGDRINSLHRNEKCGIVFYRQKREPLRFSNRYDEAFKIVNDACKVVNGSCFPSAQNLHSNIVAKLAERGIEWTGCAVITRNPELSFRYTSSTRFVFVVGENVTAIVLLK